MNQSDGMLSRTLLHATNIAIRARLNRPDEISFQVPRGSADTGYLEIGKIVRVLDGTTVIASGIIVGPLNKTTPMVSIQAFDKSEILNGAITPYEFRLESSTAIGQVRELLKHYRGFRQTTDNDFNDGTFSDTNVLTVAGNIDDEYYVVLDDTNEVYDTSGTFTTLAIRCTDDILGSPSGFSRLRYLAELGNNTEITVAFRYSNDAASTAPSSVANWSSWSSEHDLTTENTDTLGITGYSISADFRWVQLRFTLTTSDTTITPALQTFEIVTEYDMEIAEGSTFTLAGAQVDRTFSLASHLDAIREIVSLRNAEFRVNDDYELEIASNFGTSTPSVTLTVGTNCDVVRYEQEDNLLSTQVWSLSKRGSGLTKSIDYDSSDAAVQKFGLRPWIYTPVATTDSARTQEIANELSERASLALRVALEEKNTATPLSINIGDVVNFVYTARSITTTLRVVSIRESDPRSGKPRQFELISNEGFFASEPVFEEPVTSVSGMAADGEDGIGEERIYAITDTDSIAASKSPDNAWGYNDGGTVDGLEWHTTFQSPTSSNPNLFIATRQIIGIPSDSDTVDDDWTTPVLFNQYANVSDLERILDEYPLDTLEWVGLPIATVGVDESGAFSGSIVENISDYLVNTTEGDATITVQSQSSNIASATYDSTNDEIDISVSSLLANANGTVTIRASVITQDENGDDVVTMTDATIYCADVVCEAGCSY